MKLKSQTLTILHLSIAICLVSAIINFKANKIVTKDQSNQPVLKNGSLLSQSLTGEELMSQLGCNTCHPGLPGENLLRTIAPDLSHAGLRYKPAYLFDYLQNPSKVRYHIGNARMPDFNFSKKESLALTLFLTSQEYVSGDWPEFPNLKSKSNLFGSYDEVEQGKIAFEQLPCITCHTLNGKGDKQISDLSSVESKLNSDWMKKYLAAPYVYRGKETLMPNFFYSISPDTTSFIEILPGAAQKINDITAYLLSINEDKNEQLEADYSKFSDQNKEITSQVGEQIFLSQNCAACHKTQSNGKWKEKNAPDLSIEGTRVQRNWLQSFLKNPTPVRPFGYYPGSGSRMPDFNLSDQEVELIMSYFYRQSDMEADAPWIKLSAFSLEKSEKLIRNKLSCLGCHQLGGEGGKIGPDLSNLISRLKPAFVYELIQGPNALLPETIMPKDPMPQKTKDLIAKYLLQQEEKVVTQEYISLTDNELIMPNESDSGVQQIYLSKCAPCHGIMGKADGYNARFLKIAPTNHSDPDYMSLRPDDTLFDGIYAGGYILNKSNSMPAWGQTLSSNEIVELVKYMRKLCDCNGPKWSTDNK